MLRLVTARALSLVAIGLTAAGIYTTLKIDLELSTVAWCAMACIQSLNVALRPI